MDILEYSAKKSGGDDADGLGCVDVATIVGITERKYGCDIYTTSCRLPCLDNYAVIRSDWNRISRATLHTKE